MLWEKPGHRQSQNQSFEVSRVIVYSSWWTLAPNVHHAMQTILIMNPKVPFSQLYREITAWVDEPLQLVNLVPSTVCLQIKRLFRRCWVGVSCAHLYCSIGLLWIRNSGNCGRSNLCELHLLVKTTLLGYFNIIKCWQLSFTPSAFHNRINQFSVGA